MEMLRRLVVTALMLSLLSGLGLAQKKKKGKKDEDYTQTLAVPPDPPAALAADSSRIFFLTSPLSAKGLLSQQVRDGLSSLRKQSRGASIIRIRAFVAGRGDARRVGAIVAEQFTDWKLTIPTVSVVQVGSLPLDGSQVALEAAAEDKKILNPSGLNWLEAAESLKPLSESGDIAAVKPLVESVTAKLPKDLAAITCFLSSLEAAADIDRFLTATYPNAPHTLVQAQRATGSGLARCEAVERKSSGPAPRVVLTGSQIGFGNEKKDIDGVIARLDKILSTNKATPQSRRIYVLYGSLAKLAGSATVVEGVGANEATIAIDAVGIQQ